VIDRINEFTYALGVFRVSILFVGIFEAAIIVTVTGLGAISLRSQLNMVNFSQPKGGLVIRREGLRSFRFV